VSPFEFLEALHIKLWGLKKIKDIQQDTSLVFQSISDFAKLTKLQKYTRKINSPVLLLASTAVQWGHLSSKNWVVTSTKWSGHRYDLWKIRRDSDFEKSKVSRFEFGSCILDRQLYFSKVRTGSTKSWTETVTIVMEREAYEAPDDFTNSCKIFHEN
jgi:hypothetical protein